jgi:hypothetical protein
MSGGARPALGGHDRAKLIETHIKKPKMSAKEGRLATAWLNSLRVWSCEVDMTNVAQQMHNGLLLCRVMERVSPDTCHRQTAELTVFVLTVPIFLTVFVLTSADISD